LKTEITVKLCPNCHSEYHDDMIFCGRCASTLVAKGGGAAGAAPLAPLWARAAAHLLDGVLFLVPTFWLAGYAYGSYFGGLTESGFNLNGLPALVVMGATALAFFVYLTFFEGAGGATPGKLILSLRVRSVEGARCGFGRALVRNLLRLVDGIGVYLVALVATLVTKRKQRVGDLAAHTVVTREPTGAFMRVAGGLFWLVWMTAAVLGSLYFRQHPRVPPVTFGITRVRFADSEDAPPRASTEFKPEEKIQLFYDVPGYKLDSSSSVDVATVNRILAPDGKPFSEDQMISLQQKVEDATQPLKMHFYMTFPEWAPPGKYTIEIRGEDHVAHKTAEATTSFTLLGTPVEPTPTFVARDIEIANNRAGPTLNPPVLTAGQTVWLRYRLSGMKADEKGHIRLAQDFSLIGPRGNAVVEKNDDSIVDHQFFYPPPSIPYGQSVEIPSSADAGDYKFHVVLHDRIGGADFTLDQPFKIQKP
jgi:uncharacterized RDD family membrane protein YckC